MFGSTDIANLCRDKHKMRALFVRCQSFKRLHRSSIFIFLHTSLHRHYVESTLAGLPQGCMRCKSYYHMSHVSFYGEDQSEALKRHVVLSHTTSRSITRVRLTSDLPVPSAPEIFQSAMWYGIIPTWVVFCHTAWLESSKRERSMKGSLSPVVFRNQFEWR